MGPSLVSCILLFAVLIFLSIVFSLSETAFTATSIAKIYKSRHDGKKKKRYQSLVSLLNKKEDVVSTTLIANNIVNIIISSLATYFAITYYPDLPYAIEIVTAITICVVILFCEILPKTFAISYADGLAMFLAPYFVVIQRLFYPILFLIKSFNKIIFKVFPLDKKPVISVYDILKSEISFLHDNGSVVKNDRDMLDGVLDLSKTEVESIMTPKKNVNMFNIEDEIDSILDFILSCKHSRIPVYKSNQDEVIGILHVKTLISLVRQSKQITQADIEAMLFKPMFISHNTNLKQQLFEFKKTRTHMAIVVNEYGEMIGILTLEDIIEEIVGNIEDEYDSYKGEEFTTLEDGSFIVKGDYQIRDFNKQFSLQFPSDDYSSLAGMIIEHCQKIPNEGEVFIIEDHSFEIIQKNGVKITLVKFHPKLPS
jgi:Mg2+/Co2+ transporter CorB